jgi:hypothetical protein
MMQFHPLGPLALDNHSLPRGPVTNLSTIQGNFSVTSLQKLRVSKQLDITPENGVCMALNVAGKKKPT